MSIRKHALPLLSLLLCAVFILLLPVVSSAKAVTDFSTFTYAQYFTADYTVASTSGNASASGATISFDATGVNADYGLCNSTPAVESITTVTLTARQTVSVTCKLGEDAQLGSVPSEVTEDTDAGSITFIVPETQKVSFTVKADNGTKKSGTVEFLAVEPTVSKVPNDCAAFSYNDKVYNYLDLAIADATANGGTIVVTASGNVYHSSVETDDDYASKNITFTIPNGVTLLLPYSAADTSVKSGLTNNADYLANGNYTFIGNTGGQQDPNSSVTYTLTVPSSITLEVADGTAATVGNCGRIVVGGTIASGNGSTEFNGATRGAHSNLVIDGTLDLGDYAVLATTGYVLGNGNIKAEGTGAQIYQPYVVMDFPGAAVAAMSIREGSSGSTQPSGESKVSPYIYWGVVNIQAKLTMKSGNFMYAYATLGDNGKGYHTNAALVGNSSIPALLVLDSSATFTNEFETIKWSGYSYGLLGRNQIRVEGGASMGSLKLEIDVGSVDTATVVASIGYNMDVTLDGKYDYYINKSTMLLPGASLTVAEDATLTVGNSSAIRFAVWDGLIHRGYRYTGSDAYEVAVATTRKEKVNYPTNVELDKGGLSEDAELIINGKLVIDANASFGGIIQTNGGGTVEVNSAATTSVKVQSNILDRQSVNWNTRVMASMSMFDSAAKLNLNGELKSIEAGKTYIGTANTDLTNAGFTNIYYPGYDSSGNRVAAVDNAITYNSAETIKGIWICEIHDTEQYITETGKPATCTESGTTDKITSGVCGTVIEDHTEIPPLGHKDTDEIGTDGYLVCDAEGCGMKLAKLYMNANADAETELLLKFEVHKDIYDNHENVNVTVEFPGRTDADSRWYEENSRYFLTVTQPVASGEMTEKLNVTLSSTEVSFAILGTADLSVEKSIVDYARAVLKMPYPEDSTSQEYATVKAQKKLVAALVNYGGYAQTFFALDKGNDIPAEKDLASALLTEDIIIDEGDRSALDVSKITGNPIEDQSQSDVAETIIKVTQNPVLDSAISQTVFFNLAEGYTLATGESGKIELKLTYKRSVSDTLGATATLHPHEEKDGEYSITINNIPAAFLDYGYKITGYYMYGETKTPFEVHPSITSYLSRVIANNGNINEDGEAEIVWGARMNLAKAMYLYNQAANELFEGAAPAVAAEMEVTE